MSNLNKIRVENTDYDISASGANITSDSAASGQVLTANGSGGASWQNNKLFAHSISFIGSNDSIKITLYSYRNTPYDFNSLLSYLSLNDIYMCVAGDGDGYSGENKYFSLKLYGEDGEIGTRGWKWNDDIGFKLFSATFTSNDYMSDTVIPL